jgi:hypothetical protein
MSAGLTQWTRDALLAQVADCQATQRANPPTSADWQRASVLLNRAAAELARRDAVLLAVSVAG